MSAIAWELPEEVRAVRDGLIDFARKEVLPRHDRHRALFEDPRRLYREDGRFSDDLKGLIGEVRRASAKAGYYNMCVPESLGSLKGDKAVSVVFDNSKIKRYVPGYCATVPFAEGIRRTLAWFDADPARRQIDADANAR